MGAAISHSRFRYANESLRTNRMSIPMHPYRTALPTKLIAITAPMLWTTVMNISM